MKIKGIDPNPRSTKHCKRYLEYDQVTPSIAIRTPSKLSRFQIEEIKAAYVRHGWTPLEGSLCIAFVSPNGEWFNSYDIDTGYKNVFGTEWAKNALELHRERQCQMDLE